MKRTNPALAILASCALLSACGLAPEEKLAEADTAIAAHDYSGAKVYLVSALKDLPGDAETLLLLASTQIAMGDGDGALVSLDQVAPDMRDKPHYSELRSEAELLRGNYEAALEQLGEPATANSARIAALAELGLGNLEGARARIETGKDMAGNKAGLFSVQARIELSEANPQAALATAKRALEIDPENIDALLAAASSYQAAYDLPAALSAYEKAARLYPQNFAAELGRVAALGDMGRFDEAQTGTERLSQMAPGSIDVIHLKAKLALAKGQWERARSILQGHESALRQDPSMQASYATALLRVGQVGQARAWLEPLVESFPGMREPRTLLAEAQLMAGEPAKALATIRSLAERPDARPEELQIAAQAAKAAGDDAASRYARRMQVSTPEWIGGELAKADAALRNQQWSRAVKSYEAINARTRSSNAMVLNNLAFAKSKIGDVDAALQLALRAVEVAPDHPAILDTAGWLLVQSGEDRERGIRMLETASHLDPDNPAIARRLSLATRD